VHFLPLDESDGIPANIFLYMYIYIYKDMKSSEVKKFWESNSTFMGKLKEASVLNSKNIVNQVLRLHTDFSEALFNTTRETVQPVLKQRPSPENSLNEEETIIDTDNNIFLVSEHEKYSNVDERYVFAVGAELSNSMSENQEDNIEFTTDSIINDGNEYVAGDEVDVKVTKRAIKLNSNNRKEIEEKYMKMRKQYMWKLSSGRYVEEELYSLGKSLEYEHTIHSFIIDVDNSKVRTHFTEEELYEIKRASIPDVPPISDEIVDYLEQINGKSSLKEVRDFINQYDERLGESYNRSESHDIDYIRYSVYSIV